MRVISGKYRSRPIKAPNPKFTRPTTDKVKESLFNILYNSIDFDGMNVLDIYAGSGALGLEALSRGAAHVDFIEVNFSVGKILKSNISSLQADDFCRVIKTSALKFSAGTNHEKYDLIFADPPFFKYDILDVYKNIIENDFLAEEGIFIIERSIQTKEKDSEILGEPFKQIGDSLIYWFTK